MRRTRSLLTAHFPPSDAGVRVESGGGGEKEGRGVAETSQMAKFSVFSCLFSPEAVDSKLRN